MPKQRPPNARDAAIELGESLVENLAVIVATLRDAEEGGNWGFPDIFGLGRLSLHRRIRRVAGEARLRVQRLKRELQTLSPDGKVPRAISTVTRLLSREGLLCTLTLFTSVEEVESIRV